MAPPARPPPQLEVDGAGNAYIAGTLNLPTAEPAIWKINPQGTRVTWTVNLGWAAPLTSLWTGLGGFFVAGTTFRDGQVRTPGAFQTQISPFRGFIPSQLGFPYGSKDAFLGRLDSNGAVQYPRSPMEAKTSQRAGFLTKFNHVANDIFFSTYLNDFSPAATIPHLAGGCWVVGTGRDPDAGVPD